ncbi:Flp family type IVb pilin [Salibacterium salarium]|uniref:Flp family type IVb pilin n=1 Tax=Salibacterium salarium TaxID=284579 RepID=A0A3R9P1K1_9BACI|nr:Flp family type IVb pilin [Salibacterium salarium]RSL30834.1 Flp family type IVb pilin [Salibacterium salarium]
MKLYARVKSAVANEKGQSLSEYGLIIALVAIAVIGTLSTLGGSLDGIFDQIVQKLSV